MCSSPALDKREKWNKTEIKKAEPKCSAIELANIIHFFENQLYFHQKVNIILLYFESNYLIPNEFSSLWYLFA